MEVKKRTGKIEQFSDEKLRNGILKAGAGKKEADSITAAAKAKFKNHEGQVTSREIRNFVVSELTKMNSKAVSDFDSFVKTVEMISFQHAGQMEEKLRVMCQDTARISMAYGGFEIIVLNSAFNWQGVFQLLLSTGFEVSVRMRGSELVIWAKPQT